MKFFKYTGKDGKLESSGIEMMLMSNMLIKASKGRELYMDSSIDFILFPKTEEKTEFLSEKSFCFDMKKEKLSIVVFEPNTIETFNNKFFIVKNDLLLIADSINNLTKMVKEYEDELRTPELNSQELAALEWLNNVGRGRSAVTICYTLYPKLREHNVLKDIDTSQDLTTPRDGSDFARCQRFLNAVPGSRERIEEMSSVSKEWANMSSKWSELELLADLKEDGREKLYEKLKECNLIVKKPKM